MTFKIEYQAGTGGRNFGWVKVDEMSLAVEVAREGWARVKDQASSKSSEFEALAELGKAAEAAKLGIFTDDSAKQARGVSFPLFLLRCREGRSDQFVSIAVCDVVLSVVFDVVSCGGERGLRVCGCVTVVVTKPCFCFFFFSYNVLRFVLYG